MAFVLSNRFFVYGKGRDRTSSLGKPSVLQLNETTPENSLTAVVYGMVQSRKKQSLGSSLSVPSPSKQARGPGGSPRGLSVSFSLRKKSKRNGQKLQRMHSENPNLALMRREGIESRDSVLLVLNQRSHSQTALPDHSSTSHSSPDVRQDTFRSEGHPGNDSVFEMSPAVWTSPGQFPRCSLPFSIMIMISYGTSELTD